MFAMFDSASPVERALACSIDARLMLSTCSGICLVSRSARAAVMLTWAFKTPRSSCTGTSTVASAFSMATVRAASEKPGLVTITK
jgi:hypothetical protein